MPVPCTRCIKACNPVNACIVGAYLIPLFKLQAFLTLETSVKNAAAQPPRRPDRPAYGPSLPRCAPSGAAYARPGPHL